MQSNYIERNDITRLTQVIRGLAFRYLPYIDIDDLIQECLCHLLKYGSSGLISTLWLIKFVRSRACDMLRQSKRAQSAGQRWFDSACRPVNEGGEEYAYIQDETEIHEPDIMAAIESAMSTITPVQRQVIELVADDWSYQDIAAATNVPLGTVRSRLAYARRRLAPQLEIYR